MQPSQLNSLVLPIQGSQSPATLMKAAGVPLRVVVRNFGPGNALLSFDAGTLSSVPVFANTWSLPIDREDTFVLAPHQTLYAVGIGAGCVVSIAASEAIPIKGGGGGATVI
ncbi:MAG: hypothetical protein ACREJC_03975 [Tepidisphaeraceae bacterium]